MPVALVILLLDITLIYHASRTGRLQPWAFIILMIPLVGAFAYIVVELVPNGLEVPAPNRRASALPANSIRKSSIASYPIGSPTQIPLPIAPRWQRSA